VRASSGEDEEEAETEGEVVEAEAEAELIEALVSCEATCSSSAVLPRAGAEDEDEDEIEEEDAGESEKAGRVEGAEEELEADSRVNGKGAWEPLLRKPCLCERCIGTEGSSWSDTTISASQLGGVASTFAVVAPFATAVDDEVEEDEALYATGLTAFFISGAFGSAVALADLGAVLGVLSDGTEGEEAEEAEEAEETEEAVDAGVTMIRGLTTGTGETTELVGVDRVSEVEDVMLAAEELAICEDGSGIGLSLGMPVLFFLDEGLSFFSTVGVLSLLSLLVNLAESGSEGARDGSAASEVEAGCVGLRGFCFCSRLPLSLLVL